MTDLQIRQPIDVIRDLLPTLELEMAEQSLRQQREAVVWAVPAALHGDVAAQLGRLYPQGLYRHQAEALDLAARGESIVLSTSTASGKSLVFQAAAAHVALSSPNARVLVLYPTKALLEDQWRRWELSLRPHGLQTRRIHGGVAMQQRLSLLREADVLLATPDVVHAWLLREAATGDFLRQLRLLVLDEAHAYDGAFGSHMAFLLRRLRAASNVNQVIATTATLAGPEQFIEGLTGVAASAIGPDREGAPSPGRWYVRVKGADPADFAAKVGLLRALTERTSLRFLAFADSRKGVEKVVAALHRNLPSDGAPHSVLPFRSGYEEVDRLEIQQALTSGRLQGVVSTSALELGIDIGDIDVVFLINPPQTQRSLWQRAGRAGRGGRAGVCLLWDDGLAFLKGLDERLARPVEPSRLYLHNRLIQFGHAVCAAHEKRVRGTAFRDGPLQSLPPQFGAMLANEVSPQYALADDLLQLRNRLQAGGAPQLELQLRSGAEPNYRVGAGDHQLGTLTQQQMLREAYPGAIHLYMAKPYRVFSVSTRTHEVSVRYANRGTFTEPVAQAKVFPRLPAGLFGERLADNLQLTECEVQVSERVTGYREKTGGGPWVQHNYGPGEYAQQPQQRTFVTTAVCWLLGSGQGNELVAHWLRQAFCTVGEVAEGDIGVGEVVHRQGDRERRGWCLYDAVAGSLRLTSPLLSRWQTVVDLACEFARESDDQASLAELRALSDLSQALSTLRSAWPMDAGMTAPVAAAEDQPNEIRVLAPGQLAWLADQGLGQETEVLGYRFGVHGLQYRLPHSELQGWWVAASRVQPHPSGAVWKVLDAETLEELREERN